MKTYRKTATIQAEQWTDPDKPPEGVCLDNPDCRQRAFPHVHAKEGIVPIQPGNWVAVGIDGERWPIDPSIFERTYEEVPAEPRMMYEVGVEGDRFRPHKETPECVSAGCVEATKP